jgi:hypothetical protein
MSSKLLHLELKVLGLEGRSYGVRLLMVKRGF